MKTKPTPDTEKPEAKPFEERLQEWLNRKNAGLRAVLGTAIVIAVFIASLGSFKQRKERAAVEGYMSALGNSDESKRATELKGVADKYSDVDTVRELALVEEVKALLRESKYAEVIARADMFLKEFSRSAYRTNVAAMRTTAVGAERFVGENETVLEKLASLHVVSDSTIVYRHWPLGDTKVSLESKKGLIRFMIFSRLLKNDIETFGTALADLKKSLSAAIKDKSTAKIESGSLRIGNGAKTEGKYSFGNPGGAFQIGDVVCKFAGESPDLGTIGIVVDEKAVPADYRIIGGCETALDILKGADKEPISDVEISVP